VTEKHRGYLRVFLTVLLALAKAALVLLFFMHLSGETRTLKLTVILPFLIPAILALALMGDAVWRLAS
jgi:caa(3)-type oxidase subunit IV